MHSDVVLHVACRCQCDPKKSLDNAAFGKGLGRCHVRWRQVVTKLKTGA